MPYVERTLRPPPRSPSPLLRVPCEGRVGEKGTAAASTLTAYTGHGFGQLAAARLFITGYQEDDGILPPSARGPTAPSLHSAFSSTAATTPPPSPSLAASSAGDDLAPKTLARCHDNNLSLSFFAVQYLYSYTKCSRNTPKKKLSIFIFRFFAPVCLHILSYIYIYIFHIVAMRRKGKTLRRGD